MVKKIGVIVVLFVLSFSVNAQVKLTDEEIGFDRKVIENSILNDNKNEFTYLKGSLEEKVNQLRTIYVNNYITNQQNNLNRIPPIEPPLNETCINMDFAEGDFTGWCRYYANYDLCHFAFPCEHGDPSEDGEGTCDSTEEITDGFVENLDLTNNLRFEVINQADFNDQFIGDGSNFPEGVTNVARIGNSNIRFRTDQIRQKFLVSEENTIFRFNYAIVLENPEHDEDKQPFFRFRIEVNGTTIPCTERFFVAGNVPNFETEEVPWTSDPTVITTIEYLPWSTYIIDLASYTSSDTDEVTVVLETADCGQGAHLGYAYFSSECLSSGDGIQVSSNSGENCQGEPLTFSNFSVGTFEGEQYLWTFHDVGGPVTSTEASPIYTFNTLGSYLVELLIVTPDECVQQFSTTVEVLECLPEPCNDCDSFKPKPKERYVISAWTKEGLNTQVKTYENSSITINYLDNSDLVLSFDEFIPSGRIIEGWQRIYQEFRIPENTASIEIVLNNNGAFPNYFDDIRIHPFNGSMKSFAYDPETQRLMAELDQNNYGTYYEYDNEGGLIRVKKETEKGVYTIQETRSKTSIKN